MKVVLEIGFTSIKIVICVGTRGLAAQTSVKTRDNIDCRHVDHLSLNEVQAMELAKNVKRQNSQFWLCIESYWLQSNMTRTTTVDRHSRGQNDKDTVSQGRMVHGEPRQDGI